MNWLDRSVLLHPYLVLCLSEKAFNAACKHCKLDEPYPEWLNKDADATCHSIESDNQDPVCIVCMPPNEKGHLSRVVGLLAHEARHAYETMKVLNSGIPWGDEELGAVSIAAITQRLVEDWLRQIGRKDRVPGKARKK